MDTLKDVTKPWPALLGPLHKEYDSWGWGGSTWWSDLLTTFTEGQGTVAHKYGPSRNHMKTAESVSDLQVADCADASCWEVISTLTELWELCWSIGTHYVTTWELVMCRQSLDMNYVQHYLWIPYNGACTQTGFFWRRRETKSWREPMRFGGRSSQNTQKADTTSHRWISHDPKLQGQNSQEMEEQQHS